ncbi:MAG: CAP domain-containing protein [Patescibacteria group bacterium]
MKKHVHNYFIPHEGNDYTPHILQRAAMLAMLGLVLLTFTAANLHSQFWMTSDWLVSTILPSVVVELTNDERADNGASALQRSLTLDEAAELKAQHMAEGQYFSHYSPDGVSPWHWFGEVSYDFAHAGENLAIHFSDSDEVVDAWMDSPSHRANIVDQKFTEIGVGTARGRYQGFDTVYVVQLFGTPAIARPEPVSELVVAQATESPEPSAVLAETIDIIELPEPESEPVVLEEVATEVESEPIQVAESEEPVIAEVEIEDESVSVFTETVATSSGLAPAPPAETVSEIAAEDIGTFIGSVATRPNVVLQTLYVLIGLFVALALALSIVIEAQHQRPVQIAYGFGLLVLMSGLFYLHSFVTSGALIV